MKTTKIFAVSSLALLTLGAMSVQAQDVDKATTPVKLEVYKEKINIENPPGSDLSNPADPSQLLPNEPNEGELAFVITPKEINLGRIENSKDRYGAIKDYPSQYNHLDENSPEIVKYSSDQMVVGIYDGRVQEKFSWDIKMKVSPLVNTDFPEDGLSGRLRLESIPKGLCYNHPSKLYNDPDEEDEFGDIIFYGQDRYGGRGFEYYEFGGEATSVVSVKDATIHGQTDLFIPLIQDANRDPMRLEIEKPDKGYHVGSYESEVEWILSDTPDE